MCIYSKFLFYLKIKTYTLATLAAYAASLAAQKAIDYSIDYAKREIPVYLKKKAEARIQTELNHTSNKVRSYISNQKERALNKSKQYVRY